ncbi:hypothetical protein B0H15DRAFT_541307 [Mycena belliarum]|uniref:Uncharacterized protein n=1 Tax=Mycena belliarum TaxID=1033014 RepID=A0AAD6UFX9_9AGAR|nr:hypothetical protein B0H15DRAFT_541307 [Mycena belliae]
MAPTGAHHAHLLLTHLCRCAASCKLAAPDAHAYTESPRTALAARRRLPRPKTRPVASPTRTTPAGDPASMDAQGVPGVEVYRAANAGILWGEREPCAYWVEDLLGETDGLRLVSARVRWCWSSRVSPRASSNNAARSGVLH